MPPGVLAGTHLLCPAIEALRESGEKFPKCGYFRRRYLTVLGESEAGLPCGAAWQANATRFSTIGNAAEVVGQTPRSARDALVPHPEQRGQRLAGCEQADGGVGRGPGGPPHDLCRRPAPEKTSGISLAICAPAGNRRLSAICRRL